MIEWGNSNNGAWKLGVDFVVVEDTPTTTTIRADIYVWTKYATDEHLGNNTFSVCGDWSFSGGVAFDVWTNSAWSYDNIVRIYSSPETFTKEREEFEFDIRADLTNIDYPNASYVESVYLSGWIRPKPYGAPLMPTNFVATRVSDQTVNLTWSNSSPDSDNNPYHHIKITAMDQNKWLRWFDVAWLPVQESYVWNGAQPDKKYMFDIQARNRDGESAWEWSNNLYTTPSAPLLNTPPEPRITGLDDPKTQSLDLSWTYPSGQLGTVTHYVVDYAGPVSGSITTPDMSLTLDGLLGGSYTITVKAQNPGDGTAILTGPKSPAISVTLPDVIRIKPVVKISQPIVTGLTTPRTSTVTMSWNDVGARAYVIKDGLDVLGTSPDNGQTLKDLVAGKTYAFQVYPGNFIGLGTPSDVQYVTMPGVPGQPIIKDFLPIAGGFKVAFNNSQPNGSPIQKHQYRVTTKAGSEVIPWTDTVTTEFILTSLQTNLIYTLYVRSINGVGVGTIAQRSSDESGGRVGVYDGTKFVYKHIRTSDGVALVRVYDGTNWVLTPN